MAEDIRNEDPDTREVTSRRIAEIRVEALRQEENCLYTSTAMYGWLATVKFQHGVVVLAPVILTALAAFSYVRDLIPAWVVALAGLLSTLIPSLAKALDFETHVKELKDAAGEYKSLQDRFRQLANILVYGDVTAAEARMSELMDRLDAVRSKSIVVPQKHFEAAQAKIKGGTYDFSVDMNLRDAAEDGLVPMVARR
ncbi:hypothetical protein ACFOKI_02460 [Sphingomonas qilianensis]|uniref:SLATT domain-containing protein n=1 Tax=Sphingomonas qilianensis TaxID=1736690 RepID=A0ABU9XRS3_9SPHN